MMIELNYNNQSLVVWQGIFGVKKY